MKIFLVFALVAVACVAARSAESVESDEDDCPILCRQDKPKNNGYLGGSNSNQQQQRNKNYYYNPTTQKCRSFYNYGLQRANTKENRFLTRDDCETTCAHSCSSDEQFKEFRPVNGGGTRRVLNNGMHAWVYSTENYDYTFMPSLMSIDQAIQLCSGRDVGGQLVAVENEAEDLAMIRAVGGRITNDAWTSGRRDNTCSNFIWTTTEHPLGTYNHWSNKQESEKIGCIYYRPSVDKGLTWFVDPCNLRKGAICQVKKL